MIKKKHMPKCEYKKTELTQHGSSEKSRLCETWINIIQKLETEMGSKSVTKVNMNFQICCLCGN